MVTGDILGSQYRAALAMLRASVQACPESLWDDPGSRNRFWHVAYHTVFYTHLYLSRSERAFEPWTKSIPEYNFLGPLPWPPHDLPKIGRSYEPDEVLEYCDLVISQTSDLIQAAPPAGASGFSWLPMSRQELHLYNIRHIQHHAGQLIERLRAHGIEGIAWAGMRHESDTPTTESRDNPEAPTVASTVSLREITAQTVRAVCDLSVRAAQRAFVAPNAVSLAQARFSEEAWFRGVYADDTPVGFVMLHEDRVKPEYFLWRFMIDGRFQGMDFGRRAMRQVIDRVRTLPGARALLTSVVPGEGSPQGFYERLGFRLTGEWDEGEAVMRLDLEPDARRDAEASSPS